MDAIILPAQSRDLALQASRIREQGMIPAICYGLGKENISIQLDYQEFRVAYNKAGENTVIDLNVDGDVVKVLVHELQFDPIYNTVTHVDFIILNMKEKIDTHIPIVLEGEAPAVKEMGGVLNFVLQEVAVRCLPGNIPHDFKLDITGIHDFHTALHVSDLEIPKEVEILSDETLTVVNVVAPSAVEETELTPEEQEKAIIEAANKEAEGEDAPTES